MFILHATLQAFDHRDGQPLEWFSVQFHPTEPLLYGLGRDYRTIVWEIPTGRYLRSLGQTSDWIIAQALSPNGTVLAVGSADHALVLWDLVRHERLLYKDLGDHVCAVAFSPDGHLLATGHYGAGPIRLWRTADGEAQATVGEAVTWTDALAFSPDGHLLAVAETSQDGHYLVRLWAVDQRQEIAHLPLAVEVHSLTFQAAGHLLAGGAADGHLLWESLEGRLAARRPAHHGRVLSVAYAPSGDVLVSGGTDQAIHIWDGSTGALRTSLSGHAAAVTCVAFNPTGRYLATASRDRTVKLWVQDVARTDDGCE